MRLATNRAGMGASVTRRRRPDGPDRPNGLGVGRTLLAPRLQIRCALRPLGPLRGLGRQVGSLRRLLDR